MGKIFRGKYHEIFCSASAQAVREPVSRSKYVLKSAGLSGNVVEEKITVHISEKLSFANSYIDESPLSLLAVVIAFEPV